jgi:two-component system LytT family response regulator
MPIKAILIDDEPLAILELQQLLKTHPEVEITATSARADEAIELIEKHNPDLIFLDINMPGINGFELLEELSKMPQVIFVTAYDAYAIKAFEVNALDYLMKPVNPQRLAEAIARVEAHNKKVTKKIKELDLDKRIFIKDGDHCYFADLSEIYLIESVGNYARIYFKTEKPLMHRSLNYLEERLPSKVFFRANRQNIFNLQYIKNIEPYFNSSLLVELKSGHRIEMSQRQSAKFRSMMDL